MSFHAFFLGNIHPSDLPLKNKTESMFSFKKTFNNILFQHIVFWIFVLGSIVLVLSGYDRNFIDKLSVRYFLSILASTFFLAVTVYINLLILIPRFLRKRKYLYYALFQIVNIFLFIFANISFSLWLEGKILKINYSNEILYESLIVLLFLGMTTSFKLLRDWINFQDQTLKLNEAEKEKLEAELKFLKTQINPHFLFNTLNNIYSLALDNSEKTSIMILKLSDLMRYMLYDCREQVVLLDKEIHNLRNYLELEEIRLGNNIETSIKIKGTSGFRQVVPLLFVTFVENAFKHGSKSKGSYIRIEFDLQRDDCITFTVENSKDEDLSPMPKRYSGIGIQNTQKRLDLLYPKKYKLKISNTEKTYKISLTLYL